MLHKIIAVVLGAALGVYLARTRDTVTVIAPAVGVGCVVVYGTITADVACWNE